MKKILGLFLFMLCYNKLLGCVQSRKFITYNFRIRNS